MVCLNFFIIIHTNKKKKTCIVSNISDIWEQLICLPVALLYVVSYLFVVFGHLTSLQRGKKKTHFPQFVYQIRV